VVEKGAKRATASTKRIVEVLSPSHLFSEGYQKHQAATFVLIIARLYSHNLMQQVINAIKD